MGKTALKKLSAEHLESLAARFSALGEVSRLRIVAALQSGEKNVGELVELSGLSQPNVSRHLQVLTQVGLVGKRKQGLNVVYRIVDECLSQVCSLVCRSVLEK